ncbi:unnamed protein product [Symbiodinium sp. CCMP2592]|nr:unnamed protein product [Symbiodinium sp. CCMP2592]
MRAVLEENPGMRFPRPDMRNLQMADQQAEPFSLPLAVVPRPRPAAETNFRGPSHPADAANVALADEPFSLPLVGVSRARKDRAATGLSRVQSSAPSEGCPTVTTLLNQAGAPLLQKVLAFLAASHVVEKQSTGGLAGAIAQALEEDSCTAAVKFEEAADNTDKASLLLVLQQSFRDPVCHLKSLSALAADLNLARSTLSRNKQAVACGISMAISVSWGCCLSRVRHAIDSKVLKRHLLVKKRVFDETPFRMRVKKWQPQQQQQQQQQQPKSVVAKTLQTRFSLGMLLEHVPTKSMIFLHGLVVTPLQVVERTKAEDLFRAQTAVERLVPGLDKAAKDFETTVQLVTTDRYSANNVCEQAMTFASEGQARMHFWCDVHRLSTCKTWQLATVDSHISAMISLSLLMRECGALEKLHGCMKEVVQQRLTVDYGTPPAGQVQEHREAVLNLLLGPGSNLTKKLGFISEDSLTVKRARQRAVLTLLCNGDWESEKIVYYSPQPVEKTEVLRLYERMVIPSLLPAAISLFPRHRWHGGEVSIDETALLFAVHNIGGQALQLFLGGRSSPAAGFQAGQSDEDDGRGVGEIPLDPEVPEPSTEDKDPGELPVVEDCLPEGAPADSVQGQGQGPGPQDAAAQATVASGEAMPNWKELKLSMKRMVLAWIKTKPGAVLILTRATMQAGVQLMRKMLHLASLAWEKTQQLEASRGRPRSYRVLEAWHNEDVKSAFQSLRDCFHSPLPALPLTARINSVKVLGFRLLARLAGALHLLLRVTRAGFPHRLFSLLQPGTSQERLDLAEKLLSSPACLWDHATKQILEKFPSPEKLTSAAATATLQALALMAENDVVSIETRHAAARRLLMARQQTWSPAFCDLAAEHLCRQARAEMQDVFPRAFAKRHQTTSRKRRKLPKKRKPARRSKFGRLHLDRVEKRGGGAQRAFFHEKLQLATKDDWKSRGRLFSRLGAEFKALTPAQLKHYKDLGQMGTLAARHGGRPFAPPGRDSRAATEQRLVAASEFEQMALTTVHAAEHKAMAAQRLHLSISRADAVELEQYKCEHALQSHGLVDTLPASYPPVQPEPGSLPAGYFFPDAAALEKDVAAWGGRRYHLNEMLLKEWTSLTDMPAEAAFPQNFKSEAAGTVCQKFGRCVCTNREGAEQAEDSLHLHQKFVRLFRPYITLKKLPKRESDAQPQPSPSKQSRKPPARVLLDKSFLILRFVLPAEVQRHLDEPQKPGMHYAWKAALANITSTTRSKLELTEVWLHVCYCNLQTMMFVLLRLDRDDTVTHDSLGNPVTRLRVPSEPEVTTTVEAFQSWLRLELAWNVSFWGIDSSTKPIEDELVTPNTVDVRLLPDEQIPMLQVWLGSSTEARLRDEADRRAKKRTTAGGSRGQSSAGGHQSAKRRKLQPGMEPEALEEPLPEDAQDDPLQRQDWNEETFEEVLLEEQDIDAKQSFLRHYVNVLEAKQARADVAQKAKQLASGSSGLLRDEVSQWVEPSSSSSARPPKPDAARPGLEVPAAPEAEPPDPPVEAARREARATRKKKEVKEEVIWIVHGGVCYGSLRFNPKGKHITAHCDTEGHCEEQSCRK